MRPSAVGSETVSRLASNLFVGYLSERQSNLTR
nr:MAG TPA: hypothetical protein [Caudoviricetes sp.]